MEKTLHHLKWWILVDFAGCNHPKCLRILPVSINGVALESAMKFRKIIYPTDAYFDRLKVTTSVIKCPKYSTSFSSIFWHFRRSSQAFGHPAQSKAITLRDFISNWRRDIHLARMWSIGFKIRSLLCLWVNQIVWLMCFLLFLFLLLVRIVALASCSYIGFWTNQKDIH